MCNFKACIKERKRQKQWAWTSDMQKSRFNDMQVRLPQFVGMFSTHGEYCFVIGDMKQTLEGAHTTRVGKFLVLVISDTSHEQTDTRFRVIETNLVNYEYS